MLPLRTITSNGAVLFTLSLLSMIGSNRAVEDQCVGGNYDSVHHKMRDLVLNAKSSIIPLEYPPVVDPKSLPLRIRVVISLNDLTVDEENNLVSVVSSVYKFWNDTRVDCALRDSPYNKSYVFVSPYEVWSPDLTIHGALLEKKEIYADHYSAGYRLMVSPKGRMMLSSIGYFHFYCSLDFYLWPFDRHQCVMYLGADGYKKNEILIQYLNFFVAWYHFDRTSNYSVTKQSLNNYWQVEKVFSHALPEMIHSSNATNHLQYALVMRIKRSSMYYSNLSHTMAIPTTICVMLSALALLLSARNSLRFHTLLLSLVWHVLCLSVVSSQLPRNASGGIFVVEALTNSLLMAMLSMALLLVDRLLLGFKWRPMNALILAGDRVHAFFPWKMTFLDAPNSEPVNEVTSEWLRVISAMDRVYLLAFICFYLTTLSYYVILIFTQPPPSPVAKFPM